jgi:8-oxo-dGTP pyrophosphatase MutT (NUDIX family)
MFHFKDFINALTVELKKGLPGWEAQKLMSARGREKLSESFINAKNPRKSAVLVWLYPQDNSIFTRLILRTQYEGVHSGQVSFPGGAWEETDADLWQTALREAKEEVGLLPERVTLVGELSSLYIPPSNFWVHPFVGASDAIIPPVIDTKEVQRIIDTNIFTLLEPDIKEEKIIFNSKSSASWRTEQFQKTPYYNIQGYTVWGATAMILSELEELMRRIKN